MTTGRKPIHLTMTAKKPGGRQAIWEEIRLRKFGFTASEVADAAKAHIDTVGTYLRGLEAAEIISKYEVVPFIVADDGAIVRDETRESRTPDGWMLVKDVGIEAPRVRADGSPVTQGLPREQMWRTMRSKSTADFDFRDLALWSSTDDVSVNEGDAKDYLLNLAKAGYLIQVSAAKFGKDVRPARYRFDQRRNSGPKPPMVQRMKTVFDPNLRKIVWFPEVEE